MSPVHAIDLGRLRLGLLALVLALIVDVLDPLSPLILGGVAVLLYAGAGYGLGQPKMREVRFAPWVAWLPLVARGATYGLGLAGLVTEWPAEVALLTANTIAFVVLAFALARACDEAGLMSSSRWRNAAIALLVLGYVPSLVLSIFLLTTGPDLPFLHGTDAMRPVWWKTGLRWLLAAGGALGAAALVTAAWTTQVSAGRRLPD